MEFPNARRFQKLYEELDRHLRTRLDRPRHVSHAQLIEEASLLDPYFREKASRLQAFRALRNSIVHNPDSDRFDPIAEPHQRIVDEYEEVIRYVESPPLALERAVPADRLYTVTWDTPLRTCLEQMRANAYSLAPVLEGGSLAAVFMDFTLVRVAVEAGGFALEPGCRMRDLRPHLDLVGEKLGAIEYLPRTATIKAAQELFRASFRERRALRAVFITEDGSPEGELLGLLTAWDLLA